MRAERLTRKTHLKRHMELPECGELRVFDLTQQESWALADLLQDSEEHTNTNHESRANPHAFTSTEDIVSWAVATLADSPTARAMMMAAAERGWKIGLTDLHTGGFYMDAANSLILLDHFAMSPDALGRSMYFRNALLVTLIRSLRDLWHEERQIADASTYQPENLLMLERVRAADCDTVTILCCWELRGAGTSDIWRHLLGSAEGDMAMIFTRFLERDPSALFDGSALAYAFRQWYADETRVDGSDHETLELLDDVLVESGQRNPFGQQELNALYLEDISLLPDGTRYLAGLGQTILHDPFFAGLHDPINQTHLFHLIYDMEVTLVNNVPFRDGSLARKVFPDAETVRSWR